MKYTIIFDWNWKYQFELMVIDRVIDRQIDRYGDEWMDRWMDGMDRKILMKRMYMV